MIGVFCSIKNTPRDTEELSRGVNLQPRAESFSEIVFFYQHWSGRKQLLFGQWLNAEWNLGWFGRHWSALHVDCEKRMVARKEYQKF